MQPSLGGGEDGEPASATRPVPCAMKHDVGGPACTPLFFFPQHNGGAAFHALESLTCFSCHDFLVPIQPPTFRTSTLICQSLWRCFYRPALQCCAAGSRWTLWIDRPRVNPPADARGHLNISLTMLPTAPAASPQEKSEWGGACVEHLHTWGESRRGLKRTAVLLIGQDHRCCLCWLHSRGMPRYHSKEGAGQEQLTVPAVSLFAKVPEL
ncbi:uncharacterized protein B0I36DRAFT_166163 [Microdochium trichocladiopsis]|uniref:Uncharacterized protein n=1 Tax=Microdochium trichocladiopsis TaxID=1682393 RepID=A0A9P8XZ02_9PEZI|nr:uncharacterized protein B0I36DRAFT_166163 [Microdochium trichocladiopsis]KAH7025129.1 hypothetical protein B0I36DRAFT_166163 [Microdochium trichocladiopsis]